MPSAGLRQPLRVLAPSIHVRRCSAAITECYRALVTGVIDEVSPEGRLAVLSWSPPDSGRRVRGRRRYEARYK